MSREGGAPRRSRSTRRHLLRIVGAVAAVMTIAAVALVVVAVRTAGEAERNLHAIIAVAEAIAAHAKAHDGRLPSSWADIAAIGLRGPSMYAGKGIASVQDRVIVAWDFATTLDEWRSRPDRDRYLRPNGPCFVLHGRIESIFAQRR